MISIFARSSRAASSRRLRFRTSNATSGWTDTFTLATGGEEYRHSAVETLEGIRRIKAENPGVLTVLGVSNVSFGLAKGAREVVNSVFLYHAVRAGLDLAIVNPKNSGTY